MSERAVPLPRQWTREVSCSDVFLSLSVSFPALGDEAAAATMSEQLFKDILTQALTDLYGIIGGAVVFSLLELQGCSAIVRVDKRDADKVWAAAAFATQYGEHDIRLTVTRSSPFLISMAVDSREWAAATVTAALG
ncbi:Ribonuclease P protein subunit p14 [Pleodorina starrii]|nr:Ribonuclease P protein subunit p14 [Pleodorina starrii]